MKHEVIEIGLLRPNEGQIEGLPRNPRRWAEEDIDKLADSIRETPQLLEARGLIVKKQGEEYIVVGGNMRYHALIRIGATEAPCIILPEDITEEKLREIAIKDNGTFGKWDWGILMLNWDSRDLKKWDITEFEWGQGLEDGLPDELDGMDLMPDSLEDIKGQDEVARERITIKYTDDTAVKLCEKFGVPDLTSKVLWRLEDIIKTKEEQQ